MNRIKRTTAHVSARLTLDIAVPMVFTLTALIVNSEAQRRNDFCSQTARALFDGCKAEVTDESFETEAIGINISDKEQRKECFKELEEGRHERNQLCRQQRDGRLDGCKSLGEVHYDIGGNMQRNLKVLMLPMVVATRWRCRPADETLTLGLVFKRLEGGTANQLFFKLTTCCDSPLSPRFKDR